MTNIKSFIMVRRTQNYICIYTPVSSGEIITYMQQQRVCKKRGNVNCNIFRRQYLSYSCFSMNLLRATFFLSCKTYHCGLGTSFSSHYIATGFRQSITWRHLPAITLENFNEKETIASCIPTPRKLFRKKQNKKNCIP